MALRLAVFISLLTAVPAAAQDQDPALIEHTKIVSVTTEPAAAKPGEIFHLVFKIAIDPTWHIYSALGTSTPTRWTFDGPLELAGRVKEPKPKHHREVIGKDDKGKDIVVEYDYHEGNVEFRVPVRIMKNAPAGLLRVPGKMAGMECDPNGCIIFDYPFVVAVTVKEGNGAGDTTPLPADGHTRIVSAAAEPSTAKVGETFRLVFKVDMDPGWHIYTPNGKWNPTEWIFDPDVPLERVGAVDEPKPKHHREQLGDEVLEYDYHEGQVTFKVPVRLKPGAKPGPVKLAGRMTGQECSNVCVDMAVPFSIDLTVAEGVVDVAPPPPPSNPRPVESKDGDSGLSGILVWAVVGGLVSLVMPCVYPLLPITLTYFLKQGGQSRARSVAMSTAYALGIILVFTGVGFLFSIVLGADGPRLFAANPWVNIAVGLLFFWFAFSLFGLYEINLPSWLTGAVSGQQRSGVAGAFILGALFSVVTFTCTIPFAANILAVAATEGAGNKFSALIGMIVYSATMAAPFFVMGIFPSLIKEVPKSGGWLHTVKVTAAFGELALALLYFAKADQVTNAGFLTRPVMIAVWVSVLAMMALYLLGVFRMKEDGPPGPVGLPRALVSLVFIVMAVYMGSGFSGRSLGEMDILLPVDLGGVAASSGGTEKRVVGNYDDALALAKKEGKPIFLEFTGVT